MARILIADDEPETVELVSNLCRDRGHQPFHYDSSEATIDALPDVDPQLVIADLQSEKTDGFDILTGVQREPSSDGGRDDSGIHVWRIGSKSNAVRSL